MRSTTAIWREILNRCLAELEREQIGSPCPVVDHEVLQAPSDDGEGGHVWLICRTRAEARTFTDTEFARARASLQRKLLAHGFPEPGLASLTIRVTSRNELASRDGSFDTAF